MLVPERIEPVNVRECNADANEARFVLPLATEPVVLPTAVRVAVDTRSAPRRPVTANRTLIRNVLMYFMFVDIRG